MKDLVRTLTALWGPAGHEGQVADQIARLIGPHVDKVQGDALGNLIARRDPGHGGPRVMLTAHMDQTGLMVTHIEDEGYLRVAPVGAFGPATGKSQRVQFGSGLAGVLEHEVVEAVKELDADKVFVDIGAENRDAAAAKVRVGDVCTYLAPLLEMGHRLAAPAMDGRAACAVLIRVAETLAAGGAQHGPIDFVFAAQGEVGPRGIRTAAFALQPDLAVVVDAAGTGDVPGSDPSEVSLGKGVAVKVKDRDFMAHPVLRAWLAGVAQEKGIPHHFAVGHQSGAGGSGLQVARDGVATAGLSIPCRYHHTPVEMVDSRDLQAAADLLVHALQSPPSL